MQLPKMPSFSLKGRTALIVGASSGIGTACAVALAEHGAKVTLAARRKDKLEILAHQMEKKGYFSVFRGIDNCEKYTFSRDTRKKNHQAHISVPTRKN